MGSTRRRVSLTERLARAYAASAISRISYGVVLLLLLPVVLVLAIVIFVLLAVLMYGLYVVLDEPKALSPLVGIGTFTGGLLILFLILRRGHRWLTRLMALAAAPAALIDPYADEEQFVYVAPDMDAYRARLMAADARHVPPSDASDEP